MREDIKERFISSLEKYDNINLLLHDFPDPDCIGAALALHKIIKTTWPSKSLLIYGHSISRPQNKTMVKVLNINIIDPADENIRNGEAGNIFLDFNPTSTNTGFDGITPIWCIDHHIDKAGATEENCDIRQVGSACTILFDYMKDFGIELDPESVDDSNVAIGLVVGIKTDTEDLLSETTTSLDEEAYIFLRPFCNKIRLNEILHSKLPPYYYDKVLLSLQTAKIVDSLVVINLGLLQEDQRDVISYIADYWAIRKGIENVVSFGILSERSEISASLRVGKEAIIKANDLVRGIFKNGGGHKDKAGASIKLDLFNPKHIPTEDVQKFLDVLTSVVLTRACSLTGTK